MGWINMQHAYTNKAIEVILISDGENFITKILSGIQKGIM